MPKSDEDYNKFYENSQINKDEDDLKLDYMNLPTSKDEWQAKTKLVSI